MKLGNGTIPTVKVFKHLSGTFAAKGGSETDEGGLGKMKRSATNHVSINIKSTKSLVVGENGGL